jgi:hypothetical protein
MTPTFGHGSTPLTPQHPNFPSVAAPITLSLTDDEQKAGPAKHEPGLGRHESGTRKIPRISYSDSHGRSSVFPNVSSPDESADLLYEYFPLSLDDWMPPVDAVYRPHVVHHTSAAPDAKAQAIRKKSKRYFSADDT